MSGNPKDYLANLRAKISKWNDESDKSRARIHEIKVDGLVQYQRNLSGLKLKHRSVPMGKAKVHSTQKMAVIESKSGIEVIRQELIEPITDSETGTNPIVRSLAE